MGGRSRSNGFSSQNVNSRQVKKSYQGMKSYQNGKYVILTREEIVTQPITSYGDTRQTINDVIGERSRFNYCSHIKRINYPFGVPKGARYVPAVPPMSWFGGVWKEYGIDTGTFQDMSCYSFQKRNGVDVDLSPVLLPSISWTDLVSSVGAQLDGHMTTGQNLLVDCVQVSQIAGMFKNPFNLRKMVKGKSAKALSKLWKTPANAYLEYKFGWQNLYRDMLAVANVWQEVRQHQAYLEATARKYTSLSSRTSVSNTTPVLIATVLSTPDTTIRLYQTEVRATYSFSLDVKRKESALYWSKFDQVCSRLGARSAIEAIWDLVPYSFVVDWFIHLNKFIEQRSTDWNAYDIRYPGYSIKTEWIGDVRITSTATGYGGSSAVDYYLGNHVVQKKYERYSGFPSGTTDVGFFGGLSKTQLAEGVALIVQKL